MIEYNVIEDGDRNWCSQTGYTSGYHSILLGNTWRNNVPRRHNSGEATTPSTSTVSPWWTSRPEPSGPLQSNA